MKEKPYEKVVEVRRVMPVFFAEDVLRSICVHAPQRGRSLEEKLSFYHDFKGKFKA